jgi:hypothetical protein
MSDPRGIESRLDWFLAHDPSGPGMCSQHTWHALGGDQGNPPAWGCSDANAVIAKVRSSGRYWTSGTPPRGAAVYWEYGSNGHAALSLGDGRIETTDPSNGQPTGIEDLDYPRRWGYNGSNDYTLYTDQYNGVRFPIGDQESDDMADVLDYDYLDKPGGTLSVGTSYKKLDYSTWNPPRDGWENTLVYLNIRPTFKSGKTHGALRVRLMRENGDAHGYQDLPIDVDDLDDGTALKQYLTWEKGGKGDSTWIELKCIGGLASASIGTRYTSKAVVAD